MSYNFYRDLHPISSFVDVADPAVYTPVPDDWFVIITDVRGSTKAIEAGRYKEVNVLGAASIVTVLNACDDRELPFVFGGDGATVLVSANELDRATTALLGLARTAQEVFDMDLRVGVVPMADILAAGHPVGVAKYSISTHIDLAMLWGTGMGFAEGLVKGVETAAQYTMQPTTASRHPDVDGLECRWQPISARNGQMVSIIVLARAESEKRRAQTYRAVIKRIDGLARTSREMQPVTRSQLELAPANEAIQFEAKVRTGQASGLRNALYSVKARATNAAGKLLMQRNMKLGDFDGARYPEVVVANSDFRKFDDVLRMVLDLTADQKRALVAYLDDGKERGELYYGTHGAVAAMMTCVVFNRDTDHVHFIDGADGGYALAAKQLKEQIKAEA